MKTLLIPVPQSAQNSINNERQLHDLQFENRRLVQEVDLLNTKLNEALEMTEQSLNLTEIGRMRKDQDDLLELLTDQVKTFIGQISNAR